MPRRKAFDKKTSTTFSLVYRAQNDPLIHDADASDMVFTEKTNPNAHKIPQRADLDAEFRGSLRANEGEAANYGVYFDDSEYDYMQHLRDMGASREAHFVEARPAGNSKGKQRVGLDEALREMELRDADGVSLASSRVSLAESLLPEDMLPSEFVQNSSYQNQQNVPDDIAGFQPDMDPRLREVLEALEDDAYVDDDEDIFEALQRDGDELDQSYWEEQEFDPIVEEDEGWESDRTVKAGADKSSEHEQDQASEVNDNWLEEFQKFKKDKDAKPRSKPLPGTIPLDLQSSVRTGASSIAGLKRKKRKGALTATSGYSMTSSVLRRTDQLSTLDERFDHIREQYEADADADELLDDSASALSGFSAMSGVSQLSSMSKMSRASGAATQVRPDFDAIMDEFLGGHVQQGRSRVRRGKPQSGLAQLDEIRSQLGRPVPRVAQPSK